MSGTKMAIQHIHVLVLVLSVIFVVDALKWKNCGTYMTCLNVEQCKSVWSKCVLTIKPVNNSYACSSIFSFHFLHLVFFPVLLFYNVLKMEN